jgi:hypothetical protein
LDLAGVSGIAFITLTAFNANELQEGVRRWGREPRRRLRARLQVDALNFGVALVDAHDTWC